MENRKKRTLAALGGLFGAAYFASNHLLPGIPDFIMGLILGLALVCLVTGLLPEETQAKIRKWKRRG